MDITVATDGSLGQNVPTMSGFGLQQRGALVKIENDGLELEHAFEARHPLALSVGHGATTTGGEHVSGELEKDFLCPICMQTIRDAFLTACGHSFCYSCINTHLQNRQNCPCCSQFLTAEQLFPNFLLNKVSDSGWGGTATGILDVLHLQRLPTVLCGTFHYGYDGARNLTFPANSIVVKQVSYSPCLGVCQI
jgi:hypothetical protein